MFIRNDEFFEYLQYKQPLLLKKMKEIIKFKFKTDSKFAESKFTSYLSPNQVVGLNLKRIGEWKRSQQDNKQKQN